MCSSSLVAEAVVLLLKPCLSEVSKYAEGVCGGEDTSVKMITVRFHPVGGIVCTVGGSVGVSEGVPVGCSVGRTVETGNGSDDGGSVCFEW